MLDVVLLSRLQFGLTTVYHFFFVPLTIGLTVMVALMESIYAKNGNEDYRKMAKFWGKLLLINFAMGVVTGIVQEFQFGMNWSGYSRYVGDIFGAPLAIEALFAFFLESTFLGVWIFGWDKLKPAMHAACMWIVAVASSVSAFWILLANSFMQNPVGFTINNGRAEMESFLALLTNEHLWYQYPHVITGAWATAGFFVLGISAINLLKGHDKAFFQKSMKIAAVFALIGSLLVAGVGHAQGQHLGDEQPMKMAAAEALWETEDPAPLALVAIIDEEKGENTFEIAVPNALSFMMHNSFTGEVKGIHELQAEMVAEHGEGNYIPPVTVCFWAFRVMVGAGGLMILFALAAMVLNKSGKLANNRLLLKLLGLGIALPYLANSAGWILAEMGRQPWIVYGLQTVYEGVSKSVSGTEVLISLIGFALVYTVLAVVDVYLLAKNGVKDIHDLDVDVHDLDVKGV